MKKTFTFLVFFLCGFSASLKAQGILDVIHNKRYEFNNYYKEIEADKTYFQKEAEITYFSFKDDSQPSRKALNAKVFDLCKSYLENEAKYLGIVRQANSRLEFLNEQKNSRNYNYRSAEIQNPLLKSVSCDVISIVGQQVFYEINFGFSAMDTEDRYNGKVEFEVKHYYLGNLQTGTIKLWKPTITPANKNKMENLVGKEFKETYLTVTKKLNIKEIEEIEYDDEGEEIVPPEKEKPEAVNIFEKIDLAQADYYPYYSGIMIQFQEYSKGSALYGGRFFRMFFPYEQALKIAACIPEFSFLLTNPKVNSNIKNWTDENFGNTKIGALTQEPQILELVKRNKEKPLVKTLKQTSYQISDDKSKRLMNKMVTEFNANQDPLSTIVYDENGKISSSAYFDYDANNRIRQTSSKGYRDEESFVTYEYNADNNLKTKTVIDESGVDTKYFFYSNNFIYAFSHSIFEAENSNYMAQYEMKGDSFYMDKTCYLLNKNKEVIGVVSPQTSNYQMQLSRDSQGRITECYREDDRYNSYFEYDNLNRFVKYSSYESQYLKQKAEFVYDETKKLPVMKTKSMNATNLEEDYEWILFD